MSKILSMSDEDILAMSTPPVEDAGGDTQQEVTKSEEEQNKEDVSDNGEQTQTDTNTEVASESDVKDEDLDNKDAGKVTEKDGKLSTEENKSDEQAEDVTNTNPKKTPTAQVDKVDQGKESDKEKKDAPVGSEDGKSTGTPNYEEFYKQVMAPLKANGTTIDLKSPDEVLQLMRMGANYTRKMQAIAPHRKLLMMLENNGLMDEGKLSFLIDIEKKNPEAIKKLLKDSGIDPLDIDIKEETSYRGGNHKVTDEEATFVSALDDLRSNQGGTETLNVINSKWDQASKDVLWNSPEVMQVIHEQRANGMYDRIATEIERQRTLGIIPSNVPFIQAYKTIGDAMGKAGVFNDIVQAPVNKTQTKAPVATRAQQIKPVVKNNDKVNAATTTRSSSKTAEFKVNPLAMSDEEILKMDKPR